MLGVHDPDATVPPSLLVGQGLDPRDEGPVVARGPHLDGARVGPADYDGPCGRCDGRCDGDGRSRIEQGPEVVVGRLGQGHDALALDRGILASEVDRQEALDQFLIPVGLGEAVSVTATVTLDGVLADPVTQVVADVLHHAPGPLPLEGDEDPRRVGRVRSVVDRGPVEAQPVSHLGEAQGLYRIGAVEDDLLVVVVGARPLDQEVGEQAEVALPLQGAQGFLDGVGQVRGGDHNAEGHGDLLLRRGVRGLVVAFAADGADADLDRLGVGQLTVADAARGCRDSSQVRIVETFDVDVGAVLKHVVLVPACAGLVELSFRLSFRLLSTVPIGTGFGRFLSSGSIPVESLVSALTTSTLD